MQRRFEIKIGCSSGNKEMFKEKIQEKPNKGELKKLYMFVVTDEEFEYNKNFIE